jgi:hypothetical protein
MKTLLTTILFSALAMTAACVEDVTSDPNAGSNPPPDATNPVSWSSEAGQVRLSSDDFYIMANGTKYLADIAMVDVHSDPGNSQYTTLELTWMDHAVQMRLNMYFDSDGVNWWANELRTYNGLSGQAADWIEYTGTYFTSPVGTDFTGDLDLTGDASNTVPGSIHFKNMQMEVTFTH